MLATTYYKMNDTLKHIYECAFSGYSFKNETSWRRGGRHADYTVIYAWKDNDPNKSRGYFMYYFYLHPDPEKCFERVSK